MSNLNTFLETVIEPITSNIEFNEENIFYSEIMLDIDEILAMVEAPEDEDDKITFNENEIMKEDSNKTLNTSEFLQGIEFKFNKLESVDLALVA
ncbi:hypothetical protein AB6889_12115 [Carnobacterium maltaromaticum]|uniref:hypothetical protein n=1 Tax=Carnobacterium maltaromaticum TaxID=2751 RepID=UPI0039BDC0DB